MQCGRGIGSQTGMTEKWSSQCQLKRTINQSAAVTTECTLVDTLSS